MIAEGFHEEFPAAHLPAARQRDIIAVIGAKDDRDIPLSHVKRCKRLLDCMKPGLVLLGIQSG